MFDAFAEFWYTVGGEASAVRHTDSTQDDGTSLIYTVTARASHCRFRGTGGHRPMGYWDRVTAQYFITADDGSRIFLPEFSRTGFILSGPEKEAAIARFIRRHHVAMFLLSPLAPVIAALIGISTTDWVYLPVVVVLVVAGYVLPYRYGIGSLTVGLPTQAVRISFWERQRNEARVQGKITLWIEELYTLALMLGGAWFTLTFFGPDEPLALAVGVAWVLVTGWSAGVGVYQLVIIYCD